MSSFVHPVASIFESGLNFSAFNLLHDAWDRKDGLHHICHILQNSDLNAVFASTSTLDLSRNRLTNHELRHIIDALQYNIYCDTFDSISTINLSHNMLRHEARITRDLMALFLSKFPNLRSVDVTECGVTLNVNGSNPVHFDVIDSTKTRRVEWPQRRSVDKSPEEDDVDQFDFEFIDESDSDSDFAEEAMSSSDDDDEFSNLFIVGQEAESGDYEEEEGESMGFGPNALDFYALSLCEDTSTLSSCDDEESDLDE